MKLRFLVMKIWNLNQPRQNNKKTQERMKKAVLDQHPILQDHSNHETLGAHTDKFNNHHQTQTHSLN